MAEQKEQSKTLSYNNTTIDPKKFANIVNGRGAEWLDYRGIKNSKKRREVLDTIAAYRDDILSGRLTFDDINSGDDAGMFIHGVASHMKPATTTETTTKKKKAWSKASSMADFIQNAIAGEGNPLTAEQIDTWANDIEGQYSGTGPRSTSARQDWIRGQLDKYKESLANGDYDISDEDREAEYKRILDLSGNTLKPFERNAIAPWMSNLLFTDPKYYSSQEERTNAEATAASQARVQAAQDYLAGKAGSSNPYEQGSAEWQKVEASKAQAEDKASYNTFNSSTWGYTPEGNTVFRTEVNESLSPDVFTGFNPADLAQNLNAAYNIGANAEGYDEKVINPFPWTAQWLKNEQKGYHSDGQSFANTIYAPYISAIGGADEIKGSGNPITIAGTFKKRARSNTALLGKAAVDWARYKVNQDYDKYATGTGTYVLPELVNWKTGQAYVFNFGTGTGTAQSVNIGDVLKTLDKKSPLYKELLNSWRVSNGEAPLNSIDFDKEGGVLKAQKGTAITTEEAEFLNSLSNSKPVVYVNPNHGDPSEYTNNTEQGLLEAGQQQLADQYTHAQEIGTEAYGRELAGKREIDSIGDLTTSDWLRIGAAAADVTSAIAAWVPGYGSAAAAVAGLGSSALNLGADFTDESVSKWEALKGLAFNLGMDVVSLIPGLGMTGDAAKITKNITKILPKIVAIGAAYNIAPEAMQSIQKIGTNEKLTVDDWKNISYGLSAIAGLNNMAASKVKARKYKAPAGQGTNLEVKYKVGDTEKSITLTQDQIKAINDEGIANGQAKALEKFKAYAPDATALGDNVKFETGALGKLRSKGVKATEVPNGASEEAVYNWRKKVQTENEKFHRAFDVKTQNLANSTSKFDRVRAAHRDFMSKRLATDVELYTGSSSYFRNPFLKGKRGGAEARQELETEFNRLDNKYQTELSEVTGADGRIGGIEGSSLNSRTKLEAARTEVKNAYANVINAQKELVSARDKHLPIESAYKRYQELELKTPKSFEESIDKKIITGEANYLRAESELALATKNKAGKKRIDELNRKKEGYRGAHEEYTKAKKRYDADVSELEKLRAVVEGENGYAKTKEALAEARKKVSESQKALRDDSGNLKPEIKDKLAKYKEQYNLGKAKVTDIKDPKYKKLVEETLGETIGNGVLNEIRNARSENFNKFMTDLTNDTSSGKKLNEAEILELLGNKEFMKKMRASYKFKQGGILKAFDGASAPKVTVFKKPTKPVEPVANEPEKTPEPVISNEPEVVGSTGGSYSGTAISDPGYRGSGARYVTSPSDGTLTGLEVAKLASAVATNARILKEQRKLKAGYLDPARTEYKIWSPKTYIDAGQEAQTSANNLGAQLFASTADAGQGAAYRLAANKQGAAQKASYDKQAGDYVVTSVGKASENANNNAVIAPYSTYNVGESNKTKGYAKDNADILGKQQYLHDIATKGQQWLTSIQNGIATSNQRNYKAKYQNFINSDPELVAAKNEMRDLYKKMNAAATAEEKAALSEKYNAASTNYNFLASLKTSSWQRANPQPVGVPFSKGYEVTAPQRFIWDEDDSFWNGTYGYSQLYKRGGAIEEYNKNVRHYSKLYHDLQKTLLTEANKEHKMMNSGFAYFHKLMMQGK